MIAKQDNKLQSDVRSSLPPPLFKIQYPNCTTGMYSLRAPFIKQNFRDDQQEIYSRTPTGTGNIAHPEYLHIEQKTPVSHRTLHRDAEVQCSLISQNSYDEMIMPPQRTVIARSYDHDYLRPCYRVQLKLQPIQPSIYEVWNIETPPPRSIPINKPIKRREPMIHIRSPRLVNIESLSDDDTDYDDCVVCTDCPHMVYLPRHVRMVCLR